MMTLRLWQAFAPLLLSAAITSTVLAQDPPKLRNSDIDNIGTRDINAGNLNFMTIEKEIAMGRQLASEVERQFKLIDDPAINEYVNRVGQNIVRNSDAKVPVTIKVVNSPELNSVSVPGGFIYVNTGVILAADNEAELAFVIADGVAHVAARHGAEQASRGQLIHFASIPAVFFTGGAGGFSLRQASNTIYPIQSLQFMRKDVTEADYLGVQYLYKAGYDPQAAVHLLEELQTIEPTGDGTASVLSTHPATADRIKATQRNIDLILPPRPQSVTTTQEFESIKAQVAQLPGQR
jgi:predicted Zn-dependent protease